MYRYLLLAVLLAFCSPAVELLGQDVLPQLAIRGDDESDAAGLLRSLPRSAVDTNRVEKLLKAARIYWRARREDKRNLDSCLHWSKMALSFSRDLKYTAGTNEALFIIAKAYAERLETEPVLELVRQTHGELSVQLLLVVAESFVFKYPPNDPISKKALPHIKRAIAICEQVNSNRWLEQCLVVLGKYYFKQGDIAHGKEAFMQIIVRYESLKDYAHAALFWSQLGNNIPENDSTFKDIQFSHERAVHFYALAGKKKEMAYSLRDLGLVNGNHNRTDSAEKQLLRVVEILNSIGERISPTTYNILGDYYRFVGQYNRALDYVLKAVELPYANNDHKAYSHYLLGVIYDLTGDYVNSLRYYQLALDHHILLEGPFRFQLGYRIAEVMASHGEPARALAFLNKFTADHPATLKNDRQQLAGRLGYIYGKIGNHTLAEQYFQEMLSLNDAVHLENGRNFNNLHSTLSSGGSFFMIGKYYTERGRFQQGKQYLERSLVNVQFLDIIQELDTYLMLFKADSALGNYRSAMHYQSRYRELHDSITHVQRLQAADELSVRYETTQRLKDIESLKKQEATQKTALDRAHTIRNLLIAGAVLVLLLALLAYSAYRIKQRSNKKLQEQQAEINEQNQTLQELLGQKDVYLQEKEWLLKEVHHRVKNNLQIVMSLLSTQSAYLHGEDAKEAILESKNRVKSIALIHQKLYSSEEEATIAMNEYVPDLLAHLADAFQIRQRSIKLVQEIEPVSVDLSQAVPIGLILNEAITNSIKYAFGEHGGTIRVGFSTSGESATLTIADDGKGLPDNFDVSKANSLGMELMCGLARQLRGKLSLTSDRGTRVEVRFTLN